MDPAHHSSPRGWRPLLVGALAFAMLLGGWIVWGERNVPRPLLHPNHSDGRLVYTVPGEGPFHAIGDVESAALLFVGDSRIHDAIVLEELDDAATLWGPGAYLPHLLPVARRYPAQTVVVGLSFLSLAPTINPLVAEALRHPPPEPSPIAAAAQVARWQREHEERLVALGAGRLVAERFTSDLAEALALHYEHVGWFTAPLDRRLSDWADDRRTRLVPTVSTRPWRNAWFGEARPDQLAAWAGATALSSKRAQRDEAAEAIAEDLRQLSSDGRRVVCVRLPVSSSVHAAVEDKITDSELRSVAERAGVPFLEHHGMSFASRDGSHLTWEAACGYTRFLREELARLEH